MRLIYGGLSHQCNGEARLVTGNFYHLLIYPPSPSLALALDSPPPVPLSAHSSSPPDFGSGQRLEVNF